jgi:hypothetical protein
MPVSITELTPAPPEEALDIYNPRIGPLKLGFRHDEAESKP